MPTRPTDIGTLQAVAAVGQPLLMERIGAILGAHGLLAGQVLLTPHDFGMRTQYLHARETLRRLLDLGVVPVVNENDTVADDEIRYGDNDRLAALVVAPGRAPTCSCCSPTPPGCSPPIPASTRDASLIEEIVEVDAALEAVAGGAGTARGSGGMASKLAAAKIAAWSGVRAVIAAADAPDGDRRRDRRARRSAPRSRPAAERLSSRKLWIAFARGRGRAGRRRRRRPPGAVRRQPLAARRPACGASRARSTPTTRSRSSTTTALPFAKGLVSYSAGGAARRSRAARRPSSPTGCPTRSSTATTSSSCPDLARSGAPELRPAR